MSLATALWIIVPLAAVHAVAVRKRSLLAFQILLDVGLLLLPGSLLLRGLHLQPGVLGASAWGAPTTVAGSPEQIDFPLQLSVWWEEVRRLVGEGEPPWVSDRIGGGSPLYAGGQTELPFPLHLPVWVLGAEAGSDVMAVWKLELAALGGFLLLRRLRLLPAAAALGAGSYAFGALMLSWIPSPLSWVMAATPWAWYWLVGALRGRRGEASILALLLGSLAGWSVNPESAAFLWMALAGGGAVLAWGQRRRLRRLAAPFLLALPVAGVGAVPTVLAIADSVKLVVAAQPSYPAAWVDWPLRARVLALLLAPWREGHPADGTWHWGFPAAVVALWAGSVVWVFLLAAAPRQRARRFALVATAIGGAAVILVLQVLPFATVLGHVPVLREMVWVRAAFLVDFALCLLAGLAADAWLRRPHPGRLLAASGVVWLATLVLLWSGPVVASRLRGLPFLVFPAALAVVSLWYRRRWAWLVPSLALAELWLGGITLLPAARRIPLDAASPLVVRLHELADSARGRVLGVGSALPANLAAREGLADLRANDPMRSRSLARLHQALGATGMDLPGPVNTPWAGLAGAWGVRWLAASANGVSGSAAAGWQEVYRDQDGCLYRNSRWLAIVRLATRAVVSPGDPAAGGWERVDFSTTGVTEKPFAINGGGTIDEVEDRPWRHVARVTVSGRVLALLHVPQAPGWRAFLDGRREPIVEANLGAMGMVVPAGGHEVRWEYSPPGFTLGAGLTLVGLGGCLALAASSAGRRR